MSQFSIAGGSAQVYARENFLIPFVPIHQVSRTHSLHEGVPDVIKASPRRNGGCRLACVGNILVGEIAAYTGNWCQGELQKRSAFHIRNRSSTAGHQLSALTGSQVALLEAK